MRSKIKYKILSIRYLFLLMIMQTPAFTAHGAISQQPLFYSASVPPIVMLTIGRDHKLYYEAYNDASDLDDDGVIDVGYKPGIDYYGYFDSYKCYSYGSNKFTPSSVTATKKCTTASDWSGNFLNYLTTSRMDALRKVLYGGLRSTDGTGSNSTVLKRAFIPQDAHSWGKEYTSVAVDGYNISDYTPFSLPTSSTKRHLFANVTLTGTGNDPLLMVYLNKTNRIWEWVSKESPVTGDTTLGSSPSATKYSVYVDVCKTGLLETNCKAYSNGATTTYKPIGLLHTYGEEDLMYFGLLTGSYKKNLSGGVLRKNIQSFKNEVNTTTGQFDSNVNGIVSTINKLRIAEFNYTNKNYPFRIETRPINEGEAKDWGNPVAEMMYESLRYFAGKPSPTSSYSITSTDTPDTTLGLPLPNWLDPYKSTDSGGGGFPSCAKPMQLVISDINPSYDTDQLPGSYFNTTFTGDLAGLNVSTLADTIWDGESEASTVFIGQSKTVSDGAPTAKSIDSFKNIRGMAPEEPTKLGGFYAGSIALHGRQTDLHTVMGDQKAETLAVALASPLPRIEIPVGPVGNKKTVTLVPFAKSVSGATINASSSSFQPTNQIVDFYVEKIANTVDGNMDDTVNSGRAYGKFRINYEDTEQGADHDMDAIAEYTFTVNADNQLVVALNSPYACGDITQHIGYVISGTTNDGLYLEIRDNDTAGGCGLSSEVDYFLDTPEGKLPGNSTWNDGVALPFSTSRTFSVGTTSASYINHDPLWYAAKWGASDKNDDGILDVNEWDVNSDGKPDNYFLVTNAGKLQEQLNKAFAKLLDKSSSASSVAANATRLDTGTLIYQAKFDTKTWSGKLLALSVNASDGAVDTAHPNWEASEKLPAHGSRKIYTYNPQATAAPYGIPFLWNDLDTVSQAYLNQVDETPDLSGQEKGELRLNWLRGDTTNEALNGGPFRDRKTDCSMPPCVPAYNLLGDIINSDPIFIGIQDYDYDVLPNPEGESYVDFRNNSTYKNRRPMLYVGANDGMLHGFDARKNAESVTTGGTEVFAYIPNALFPKLSSLTSPAYSHQYFVDGLSTSSDAYLAGTWRTLLVGTTGAGGRAVFALDVTYPDDFSASNVLWEFTGDDDSDLGYTLAQPSIVRMNDGRWVVIVGNGYESDGGRAVLFILDAKTGEVIKELDTGVGDSSNKNGLSSPLVVDIDNDHIADTIYAGDLYGNLWKFDVRSGTASDWLPPSTPFFVACAVAGPSCSVDDRQPITAKPTAGAVDAIQGDGIMLYFGTGKYFETDDNIIGADPQMQTFYGLWDKTTKLTLADPITDRANLQTQQITFEGYPTTVGGTTSSLLLRLVSEEPVCYAHTSKDCTSTSPLKTGWLLNLAPPDNTAKGERVISAPLVRGDLIIFATLTPNPDPCEAGGTGILMELDATTGQAASGNPAFDVDNNGIVDKNDEVVVDGKVHAPSGADLDIGIFKTPGVIESPTLPVEYKYESGSTAAIGVVVNRNRIPNRRSWMQLR